MSSRDRERRKRRTHFFIFDFITMLLIVSLCVVLVVTTCKSMYSNMTYYDRVAEEAEEEIPLDVRVGREKWSRFRDYPEPPQVELVLLTGEEKKEEPPVEDKKADSNYLGRFRITHYCDCESCQGEWVGTTATGVKPTVGKTIAVDPRVIPLGSKVVINGHTYTAQDTGGAIRGNRIDVFVGSHEEANRKGVYYAEVYRA